MKNVKLIYVEANIATQSNKYYNMIEEGSTFKVEYGRVGSTKTILSYPISKWNSIYRDKVNKGYKDITELSSAVINTKATSGNIYFDEFYSHFKNYSRSSVQSTYLVEGCTKQQIQAAQKIIDTLLKLNTTSDINDNLIELYKIIPRKMSNVRDYLIQDKSQLNKLVSREQDALDSMDSNNIVITTDPLKELGVNFDIATDTEEVKALKYLIQSTLKSRYKIHKIYNIQNYKKDVFDNWLIKQNDKSTELLIHGTRNANIFSILKSDLLIRPSNAAGFAGSSYGDGIYHSAHSDKSLNYTGYDNDKIFFIQRVHTGNKYVYNGWYRDGKDIGRHQMNYGYLSSKGYDSLYVKPGDGLLNSEYIVYNQEQTVTNYLIWLK